MSGQRRGMTSIWTKHVTASRKYHQANQANKLSFFFYIPVDTLLTSTPKSVLLFSCVSFALYFFLHLIHFILLTSLTELWKHIEHQLNLLNLTETGEEQERKRNRVEKTESASSSSPSRSSILKINLQGHHMLLYSSASLPLSSTCSNISDSLHSLFPILLFYISLQQPDSTEAAPGNNVCSVHC